MGLVSCPACHDAGKFKKEMLLSGIWFGKSEQELRFASASMKPASTVINFLAEKIFAENLSATGVSTKFYELNYSGAQAAKCEDSLLGNELDSTSERLNKVTRIKESKTSPRNQTKKPTMMKKTAVSTMKFTTASAVESTQNASNSSSNWKSNVITVLKPALGESTLTLTPHLIIDKDNSYECASVGSEGPLSEIDDF